jgi:hypothetical protein
MDDIDQIELDKQKYRRMLLGDKRSDAQKIADYQNARVGYEQPEDMDNLDKVNPDTVDKVLTHQGFYIDQPRKSNFERIMALLRR